MRRWKAGFVFCSPESVVLIGGGGIKGASASLASSGAAIGICGELEKVMLANLEAVGI